MEIRSKYILISILSGQEQDALKKMEKILGFLFEYRIKYCILL